MAEKQKILIVDDRKENLVALRQVLSGVDAEIIEATSGNQALAVTLDHDFAVVLLDVQMPGMSGYELAEHLRGDKKTRVIPIVFLTATSADEQYIFKGYEAGGVDYIMKPYPPAVLRGKVNVFLEMARYRRELEMHRNRLETLVEERTWRVNKRDKELKCLYAISSLVAEPCKSVNESLEAAVNLIPPGWQYPEITRARIVFEGREFASANFRDTAWKQSADIMLSGETAGTVEVCHLEERPALDEGPFLKEERDLILNIARQLGDGIERKRAETRIKASEVRYRRLFETAQDAILILDATTGKIIDANPFIMDLLGYSHTEFVGKELWQIGLFKDIAANQEQFLKLQKEKYVRYENLPLKNKSGEERDVEFVSNVYEVDHKQVVQCNIRDITEREQAKVKLEKAYARLKKQSMLLAQTEKMSAIGTLAAGTAHELNNPIMGILNFTAHCIKHTSEEDQLYTILQDIEHEAKRCAEIVRNLLTFSHVERDDDEAYQKGSLTEVLGRVLTLLRYRIEKRGVSVTQHIADDTPEIWMNPNSVQQLILNLIANALDALEDSPIRELNVEIHSEGEFVQMTIADTGCGIAAEHLGSIFDPFFTTKPVGQGTGLGLSVCQGIVETHGGKITCESEPGAGAKFTILLPVEKAGKEQIKCASAYL